MSEWIDVKSRLPAFEQIVIVRYASGYDGGNVYAWGARIDDSDGWLWGVHTSGCGICIERQDLNDIEADDDYPVTHWMPLPEPPPAAKP